MSTLFPARLRLSPDAASSRQAREVVEERTRELLAPDAVDSAVLATSELVTNAVEHGAPPIELRVEERDGAVRIEVHDTSPDLPRIATHDPGPEETRGRGMLIVARCTARWGVTPGEHGKAVWFELDQGR
jgi:anti-sigma regulatory factor (Ser/Thr protein kinase)